MVAASNLITALSLLGREAARMVLPSPCVVCDEELPWRSRAASCCMRCWDALPRIVEPKCTSCAAVWTTSEREVNFTCGRCIESPPRLEWVDAWGHYSGGLEKVLHAFKFQRHQFLAASLAELLKETLQERGDDDFDCIVPVPMHRRKERQRGYNQAELLGLHLSRKTRFPMRGDLAGKAEARKAQSTLARAERRANVSGSFAASNRSLGLSVLIVDDICTTGETLNACAAALLGRGARRVCGLVVARA